MQWHKVLKWKYVVPPLKNGVHYKMFIPSRFVKRDGRKLIVTPEEDIEAVESETDAIPPSHLARQLARAHA